MISAWLAELISSLSTYDDLMPHDWAKLAQTLLRGHAFPEAFQALTSVLDQKDSQSIETHLRDCLSAFGVLVSESAHGFRSRTPAVDVTGITGRTGSNVNQNRS
jgi:hypothetical protein